MIDALGFDDYDGLKAYRAAYGLLTNVAPDDPNFLLINKVLPQIVYYLRSQVGRLMVEKCTVLRGGHEQHKKNLCSGLNEASGKVSTQPLIFSSFVHFMVVYCLGGSRFALFNAGRCCLSLLLSGVLIFPRAIFVLPVGRSGHFLSGGAYFVFGSPVQYLVPYFVCSPLSFLKASRVWLCVGAL